MLFQKMTGRRSLCGFEACGWSLKHESFEACGKVKGNTEKQCDHDYIPPSKNVDGSVSTRSIREQWNSSQSQSHPALAPAATVFEQERQQKQASKAFQEKR
jgi:hypothetical protein